METKRKKELNSNIHPKWMGALFKILNPKKKGSIFILCTRVAPPICAFFNEIHYHS